MPDTSRAILWPEDPAARFEWMTGTQDPPLPPRETLAALYREAHRPHPRLLTPCP